MILDLILRSFSGRSSLENPRMSLKDPSTWDAVCAAYESDTGIKITPQKMLGIAAVWQAVTMISGDVAKLPLGIYKRIDDDRRELDRAHPAQNLIRRRANAEQSAFRMWRTALVHQLIWNNAYIFIDRDLQGRPRELINLLPDRTGPERHNGELIYVTETTKRDGSPWLRPIDAADVIHLQGISIDGIEGLELVQAARHCWGLTLALQKFASKYFRNGVRSGGTLELPREMKPTTMDKVEEGFRKAYTGEDNWFKTVILRDGAKFHQTTQPPNEAQMNESREQQVREVARYYNLAPSRLGLSDSVSYNSKAEDNQAYLDTTLSPYLADISGECDLKLLTEQQVESHYCEHNTAALLKMNTQQRYQIYAIAVRNRLLTPNECRAKENLPPLEGGDEFPTAAPKEPAPGSSDGGNDKAGNEAPRGPAKEPGEESPE